jgi:hypothetical protein
VWSVAQLLWEAMQAMQGEPKTESLSKQKLKITWWVALGHLTGHLMDDLVDHLSDHLSDQLDGPMTTPKLNG